MSDADFKLCAHHKDADDCVRCRDEIIEDLRDEIEELRGQLEAVVKAARMPECNFHTERECGYVNGVYRHHRQYCPRGRLEAELEKFDES